MAPPSKSRQVGRRVAVVAGLRTGFVKSGTSDRRLAALDLAIGVVNELVARTEIDVEEIDELVFGQVVPSLSGPNVAREVVLNCALPQTLSARSVSQACINSIQARLPRRSSWRRRGGRFHPD